MYSIKWLFDFSTTKSGWMILGKDDYPDLDVCLGDQSLQKFDSVKHMGITLCSNTKENKLSYLQRISKGRSVGLASKGIGSQMMPVNPAVLSKLYWSIAIPRIHIWMCLTSLSILCLTNRDM